jgi:hypothetical protein
METYCVHLNPSTVEKLENIAKKLDLSLQESFNKAMHFYLLHQLKSAHRQKMYLVFEQPDVSFDQYINDYYLNDNRDLSLLEGYGKSS